MNFSSFVYKLNFDSLRAIFLKILFRKNGLALSYFKSYNDSSYFVYCVNGDYLACESINWFVSLRELEKQCYAASLRFYRPQAGDVIVDIGAGLGEEAVVFSKAVGPSGRVLAVEANPDVNQVLSDIVRLNKISNVDVMNAALSSNIGNVNIHHNMEIYLSGSMQKTGDISKISEVEGFPLSEIVRRFGIEKIDLLKVNIEGAERFLVEESRPEVFERVRNIAISCHDFRYRKEGFEFFRTKDLISDYFRRVGFQIQMQSTGVDYIDDWIYGARN